MSQIAEGWTDNPGRSLKGYLGGTNGRCESVDGGCRVGLTHFVESPPSELASGVPILARGYFATTEPQSPAVDARHGIQVAHLCNVAPTKQLTSEVNGNNWVGRVTPSLEVKLLRHSLEFPRGHDAIVAPFEREPYREKP